MRKPPLKVDYYRDGSRWVASLNKGSQGFFILYSNTERWSFVAPGSRRWDSLHQDAYFAHHDFCPCHDGEEQDLPLLPPVPEFNSVSWKENFLPEKALSTDAYPMVTELLHGSPEQQTRVWIILSEDQYETLHGDGCFRYFGNRVFLSESDACVAAAIPEGGQSSSVTSVVIGLDGDAIVPVMFEPAVFEHYDFENVVSALDEWIALGVTDRT